jgi:excisionase family DNA binding protein
MSISSYNSTGRTASLLTTPETAQELSVSPRTVQRLRSAGILTAVRIGRSVRYRSADVAELIGGDTTSEATGAHSDGFAKPAGGAAEDALPG